jgi:hypothetical protein
MSDARCLFSQAELCFRLASGPASTRLADELEALGRTFAEKQSNSNLREREGRRRVGRLRYPRHVWAGSSTIRSYALAGARRRGATLTTSNNCHRVR